MTFCDLHTHSYYSDGSDSPRKIIELAAALGLAVALTDHNTTSGLDEFMLEADRLGVRAVAGVELSTLYGAKELHLLGLFLPREHYGDIEALVKDFKRLKEQSNLALIEKLASAGYKISYDEIKSRSPEGNVNRAHVAAELTRLGYVSSMTEAFDTLLSEKQGFYTPPPRPDLFDTISFLRNIRTLPVLAHPLQELSADELCELLPRAIDSGLVGIETLHSSYTEEQKRTAADIAKGFKLLASGGSDYHGENKQGIALGVGKGDLCVPIDLYEQLATLHTANFT